MIKYFWAFVFTVALIPLDAERSFAQLFSSTIEGNNKPWSLTPVDEIKIAQASPESEGPVVEQNTSSPDFESRFAKNQYEFGLSLGYGFSINLPAETGIGGQRT